MFMLQDDLADGAGPSGDQQDDAPQSNALEQEAAAAVRPDEADCKPSNAICTATTLRHGKTTNKLSKSIQACEKQFQGQL